MLCTVYLSHVMFIAHLGEHMVDCVLLPAVSQITSTRVNMLYSLKRLS